jgi:uncharacterized repeat protein (TIGR02543 family)
MFRACVPVWLLPALVLWVACEQGPDGIDMSPETVPEAPVPPDPLYTVVTFHPSGGSPSPEPQTVAAGGTASQPNAMAKPFEGLVIGTVDLDSLDFTFDGWYTDETYTTAYNFNNPVIGSLDLYAKWTEPASSVDISAQNSAQVLEQALNYVKEQSPSVVTNYTIVLAGTCTMPGIINPSSSGRNPGIGTDNAIVTLVGKTPTEITLSSGSTGALFYITGGKLILDNNITLKGLSANTSALVNVSGSSSALTMRSGSKITGNNGGFTYSAVSVLAGGAFIMEGGEISGNTAGGSAVYVTNGSAFTMNGGKIFGNTATSYSGGGVYSLGSFNMVGGEISDNTAAQYGGGVFVYGPGVFTMSGGEISGNTAGYSGGGVFSYGSFDMTGGEISGSTAGQYGGGVFVSNTYGPGIFTMSGGEISGNTADSGGGVYIGVYNSDTGSFHKTGGVIYGDIDTDPDNGASNTAKAGNTNGHAVYYAKNPGYYRNDALNVNDGIDTAQLPDSGAGYNWIKR